MVSSDGVLIFLFVVFFLAIVVVSNLGFVLFSYSDGYGSCVGTVGCVILSSLSLVGVIAGFIPLLSLVVSVVADSLLELHIINFNSSSDIVN